MYNPIIVALDLPDPKEALKLVEELAPVVGAFKIGSELFTSAGPEIVRSVRATGVPIFLDLKFHDIPNTVSGAVAAAVSLDVQMLTVHTSGGLEMMQAAQQAAEETALQCGYDRAPLVLGVTVLTSLDSYGLDEVGQDQNLGRQVERLAELSAKSGLRGLVCSPLEIAALRQLLPNEFKLVTPGVRNHEDLLGDQKRTLTPREAIKAGASWLVIGRPICNAERPREAASEILRQLGQT